jgi:ethanolamine utilization protein EutA (predicted chaperonin)
MVKCPLDVHDEEAEQTVRNQQFVYYLRVVHVVEAIINNYIFFLSNNNNNILLFTGDFGRAKTPTIATVKASYFPLIIIESVGI